MTSSTDSLHLDLAHNKTPLNSQGRYDGFVMILEQLYVIGRTSLAINDNFGIITDFPGGCQDLANFP